MKLVWLWDRVNMFNRAVESNATLPSLGKNKIVAEERLDHLDLDEEQSPEHTDSVFCCQRWALCYSQNTQHSSLVKQSLQGCCVCCGPPHPPLVFDVLEDLSHFQPAPETGQNLVFDLIPAVSFDHLPVLLHDDQRGNAPYVVPLLHGTGGVGGLKGHQLTSQQAFTKT